MSIERVEQMSGSLTMDELKERLAWPLDRKIQESEHRMEQWFTYWRERGETVSLSFSGGLDSTVMLHILRNNPFLKNENIPVIFADTGIEYPEIRDFVHSTEDVTIVKATKPFIKIIEEDGYPVVSKRVAQYLREIRQTKSPHMVRLRLTGWRKDGTHSPMGMISKKWHFLVGAPFKVSDRCCDFMKKIPMSCMSCPYIGVRADEGQHREKTYLQFGCNYIDTKNPRSWPMAFWTDGDIREYIKANNVPYSPIYDMGYRRTGCYPCCFGLHLEAWPNRFQLMEKTHPRLYNHCMDKIGIQRVLEFMNEWLPKKQQISFRYSDYIERPGEETQEEIKLI